MEEQGVATNTDATSALAPRSLGTNRGLATSASSRLATDAHPGAATDIASFQGRHTIGHGRGQNTDDVCFYRSIDPDYCL